MIVYIASYPKSGNIWVRAILRTLTSSKLDINTINLGVNCASKKFTGITVDSNIIRVNKIVRYARYKKYIDSDEIKYLKVHDAFDKELFPDKTKVIPIARNPLDVAVSYSHYNSITIDSATQSINSPENIFKESETFSRQYLGSWKDNTESWLSSDNNILLIKYEDLLADVKQEIIRISEFLNIMYTEELLELVKHETSFKNMKEQEKKFGFKEKPKKCNVFFRTGEKDQYKYRMTEEQIKSVIDYNKETMLKIIRSLESSSIEIISGDARGADKLGAAFAKHHNLKLKTMPADWTRYGNSAGYRRNAEMAVYAAEDPENMLVAFWDGESKGTGHMVDLSKKYNMKYVKIFQGGQYAR